MSITWAIIVGIFLPDNPIAAKFISEREKAIAVDRVRNDQTGIENKTFKKEQMIEAFLDVKTWLMFFFVVFIAIPNGGLTNVSVFARVSLRVETNLLHSSLPSSSTVLALPRSILLFSQCPRESSRLRLVTCVT
jgi:hypothetical protein